MKRSAMYRAPRLADAVRLPPFTVSFARIQLGVPACRDAHELYCRIFV